MKITLQPKLIKYLFFLSCIILMLPPIMAFALTQINMISGCSLEGPVASNCQTIGKLIQSLLQLNQDQFWFYFQSLGLPIWLVLFLSFKGFKGWKRWVMGFATIWMLPHFPLIMGGITAAALNHQGCNIVGDCVVFRVDMSSQISVFQAMPWSIVVSLPVCSLATAIFASVLTAQKSKSNA